MTGGPSGPAPAAAPRTPASASADDLLARLDLAAVDDLHYQGTTPEGGRRLFGGLIVAQGLAAAHRTVGPDRHAHSLHAYFLQGGAPGVPVDLAVTPLRDGRSYSARRVTALQGGQPICELLASFHVEEPGHDWQPPPPEVPGPEDVAAPDLSWTPLAAFDIRPVHPGAGLPFGRPFWVRLRGPIDAGDRATHACLVAFLSDIALMGAAIAPGTTVDFARAASLDHAVWFHRPARADEWLLYSAEPVTNAGAHGLARGTLHDQGGRLVASVAQEALLRRG